MSAIPEPLHLAEGQWIDLRRAIVPPLPETSRDELEVVLGYGRFFVAQESSAEAPHLVKSDILAIGEKAIALLADVQRAAANPNLLEALTPRPEQILDSKSPGYRSPVMRGFDEDFYIEPWTRSANYCKLQEHIASLASLADWFEKGADRVSKGTTGDRTSALHDFTKDVNRFLVKHTGKGLTRGSNPRGEFLGRCLRVLGVDIATDTLIRKLTSERRGGKVSAEKT